MARIQGDCVTLVVSLAEPSQCALSRKIAALVACHLAAVVPFPQFFKTYFPFLRKAALDSNWQVRQTIALQIPLLCSSLGTASVEPLFSLLSKLLEDPQPEVFAHAAESLGLIMGECRSLPLFDAAIEKLKTALAVPNAEVLKATVNNIGKVLVGIGREKLEKSKELGILLQGVIKSALEMDMEGSGVSLAKNLPAIVAIYGTKAFIAELFKIIEKLMSAKNPCADLARATFANCFHEIVKQFGFNLAIEKLRDPFFSLLTDSSVQVVDAIFTHIEATLQVFFSQQKQEACTSFISDYFSKLPLVHQKVASKSWRTEAKFLEKLDLVLLYLTPERFSASLMPIFKATLSSSPRECKLKVCNLLSQILSGFCQNPIRLEVHSLAKHLVKSPSYQNRVCYLEFVCSAMKRMSKHYIRDNFLASALALGEDKVVGVQWKFCEASVRVKKSLLPEDFKSHDKLTLALEKIYKTTKSQSLKEKAESALKRLEAKNGHRNGEKDKDEELLMRREREIQRREAMQMEDCKRGETNTRSKHSSKDLLAKKGNSRTRKATHLVSSVTATATPPILIGVRKPSTGSVVRRQESDKFGLDWAKSLSRPLQKVNKRADLAKSKI